MAQVPPGAGDTGEGAPVWGKGLRRQLCASLGATTASQTQWARRPKTLTVWPWVWWKSGSSDLHKVVPVRHSSGFPGVALGPPQLGPGQKHKVPGPSLASSKMLGLGLF